MLRNYIKFGICICTSLLLLACGEEKSEKNSTRISTIHFKGDLHSRLFMSSFVDTIEFIPLETTDENLIGEITRVVYRDGKYYMRTTRGMRDPKMQVFDAKGTSSYLIGKRGGGPEGYVDFDDFILDENSNVYIVGYHENLMYSSKGDFLYKNKTEESIKECYRRNDGDLLIYNMNVLEKDCLLLSIVDINGKLKKRFFKRSKKEINCSDFRIGWRSFAPYDSICYFIYPCCDTIFSINNEDVSPVYLVDYGKKKLPLYLLDEEDGLVVQDKKLSKVDDYVKMSAVGVADDYLYVGSIDKSYNAFLTLYSKKSQHVLTGHQLVDDMFLIGNVIPITAKQIPHNMVGNDILFEVEPKYLIDGYANYMSKVSASEKKEFEENYPQLAQMCANLKEDDNPVLMRIKVKDF